MKKIFLLLNLLFLSTGIMATEKNTFLDYCKDKEIKFLLYDSNTNLNFTMVWFNDGKVFCDFSGGIMTSIMADYQFFDDYADIYFYRIMYNNYFELEKSFKYRNWLYPEKYKFTVTIDELKKAYKYEQEEENKRKYKTYRIPFNTSVTYPAECQAIVIDNLSIRESPSLTANKIGRYEKRTEITLYGKSEKEEEIDGIKSYWYKVKLNDDSYGWVFGGYVRIFFEDDSLGYSDKELILKYIE